MLKKIFLFLILFPFSNLFSQINVSADSVNAENGFSISQWKYKNGDDISWAKNELNDSLWATLAPEYFDSLVSENAWFRCSLYFDPVFKNTSLSFLMLQTGASEIYLDGILLEKNGTVSTDAKTEERYNTRGIPIAFNYTAGKIHHLAVRYSNHDKTQNASFRNYNNRDFNLRITNTNKQFGSKVVSALLTGSISALFGTFFLSLGLVHLLIYLFYRRNKSNIYYFYFALILALFPVSIFITNNTGSFLIGKISNDAAILLFPLLFISLIALLNSIFHERFPKKFRWQLITVLLFDVYFFASLPGSDVLLYIFILYFSFETLIMIIKAVRTKKKGAKIIGAGVLFFIGFILLAVGIVTISIVSGKNIRLTNSWLAVFVFSSFFISIISIPLSMSVYLAKDFALTNKNLEHKLIEVEELSARSIEQEKEKQRILETQKENLEVQVKERTYEIVEQKKQLEEKNKDITDSINYAKRIQDAILPAKELKYKIFPSAFVLFKPKDIVSGDFYWFAEKDGRRLIAVCDCTGHGVPGALMSMIGNSILNQIVNEQGITSPEKILELLNKEIRKALKQDGFEAAKDGMDIALLSFTSDNEIEYAGAQRPLWLIRNGELTEIKADKYSIGGLQPETEKKFHKHCVTLEKNDCIYIFSDGYVDQFGGEEGKKFMSKQFRNLVKDNYNKNAAEQEIVLDAAIEKWKGSREQIDDILVIGIKI